jgi:hypothetical protein
MFRRLRAIAEMSTTGVRDATVLTLLEEGYGSNDANVVAIACHPFDVQKPRPRAFEDTLRQSCVAFGMQSRNAGQKEAVELAVTVLQGYLAMARQAGDQHYSEWFGRVLQHHEEESEVLNDEDKQEDHPPRSSPSMRRRSEPLRADREAE